VSPPPVSPPPLPPLPSPLVSPFFAEALNTVIPEGGLGREREIEGGREGGMGRNGDGWGGAEEGRTGGVGEGGKSQEEP